MQRIHTDDQAVESQIQAKGKTAPRITPADIQAVIGAEFYFTAHDGIEGAIAAGSQHVAIRHDDSRADTHTKLLTFCVLVLKNGFTVTGESACASPENFDAQIGRDVARKNAVDKVWPLLGYALKQDLHRRAVFDAEPKTGRQLDREYVSFKDFVQYGRDNGGNIVNGMPWSFTFKGYGVTHENDKCYLLMRGSESIRLTDDDDLVVHGDGTLSTAPAIPF